MEKIIIIRVDEYFFKKIAQEYVLAHLFEDIKNYRGIKEIIILSDSQRLIEKAKDIKKGIQAIQEITCIIKRKSIVNELSTIISQRKLSAYIYIDKATPCIDQGITEKLLERVLKYKAEYGFSDNTPPGLVPQIITPELLELIYDEDGEDLFQILSKDINIYDIELYFHPIESRGLRISFIPDSKQNILFLEKLYYAKKLHVPLDDKIEFIRNNCEILRLFPAYMELEITTENNQQLVLSPYRYEYIQDNTDSRLKEFNDNRYIINKAEISIDTVKKISSDLDQAPFDDIWVSMCGAGEPLLHPKIKTIIEILSKNPNISKLIIETNGILLHKALSTELLDLAGKKLIFIIKINSFSAELYKKLHGASSLEIVKKNILDTADILKEREWKGNLYVEILKLKENEEEIDPFYEFWTDKIGIDSIILQKYNSFIKRLPNRQLVDLSPLERDYCRHLARDMVIWYNGDVPICKQYYFRDKIIGNISKENLFEIWKKGNSIFVKNFNGDYSGLDCEKCDEWYTFNH